uniref:Uncharacterized protein n=1 Tax=Zea mays TaxID=4577 RepID=A0A804RLT1_MAIZE
MSSVGRQDSMDSLDCSYYLSDGGLVEAPTLSSKQIEHARKQALTILETKSPEEVLKIFTEGSEAKADLAREKAHTPTTPPKGADAKATTTSGTVRTSPPTN